MTPTFTSLASTASLHVFVYLTSTWMSLLVKCIKLICFAHFTFQTQILELFSQPRIHTFFPVSGKDTSILLVIQTKKVNSFPFTLYINFFWWILSAFPLKCMQNLITCLIHCYHYGSSFHDQQFGPQIIDIGF